MGLKIKSLSEILSDMVTWISTNTKKITDFNIGSATRTLLEAISLQMEEFYFSMYENIMWAIENSIYKAFSFDLKGAKSATGFVTMFFNGSMQQTYTIKAGTKFTASNIMSKSLFYSVVKDIFIPEGTTEVLLPVRCDELGEIGNIPINSIIYMVTPLSFVKGISNATNIIGGVDSETKAERKQRFLHYIQTLARGTVDAIAYGCLEVSGIKGVWIDDTRAGLVQVYVHDLNGELSDELQKAVYKNLENYRAAGVEVQVLPVFKKSVDLEILIVVQDAYDSKTYVLVFKDVLTKYLDSMEVSKNLYMSELIQYVTNLYDDAIVSMKINNNDIFAHQHELIRSGNIVVNVENLKDWR